MKSIRYNNNKVCDLTPLEYESLCLLLPYWGMQIDEEGENISGALSTFRIGVQGLSQQHVKELEELLHHTGIKVTTDDNKKCDQRFYLNLHEGHPMPLAINTPDKQLYYLNPATTFHLPVQAGIHKGITLKRKDGPLFLAIKPKFEKQVPEWLCYLIIQSFMRFSFESLASVSESTFTTCVNKVLQSVNARFAETQLPKNQTKTAEAVLTEKKESQDPAPLATADEPSVKKIEDPPVNRQPVSVPPIRPFSPTGSLITKSVPKPYEQGQFISKNAQPINPFKSASTKRHPIKPFNTDIKKNEKSVIRPFHTNQNTPSGNQEYTKHTARLFRQRRDGK
ncbi:hypothetical protein [Fictibacillus phosphorivorans]|uniref:hypothetical protein n=1 Tax=Fictibacillus phosphorivorans TaxID=1221500 RepID=UPI002041E1F3|nr:hypothetical protein [Fictibacillus phosphorivorans]MCM3719152.1 hypothetical protein [Fictibacillus phosphorivorans]MCM3776774.1 hypothetical protein [Fictibacillus phosphorivorans]